MNFWFLKILRAPEGESGAADGDENVTSPESAGEIEAETGEDFDGGIEGEAPTAAAPQSVPYDIFQRRLAQLNRQKAQLQEELARTRQQQAPTPPAQDAGITQEMVAAMAAHQILNQKSQEIADKGAEIFGPEFMSRINMLNATLGTLTPYTIEAVIEASGGDAQTAAKIFHELGGNLDEAARVLVLPPMKQAVVMAKMAEKVKGKPKAAAPSRSTPSPIAPKQGSGTPGSARPDLTKKSTSISDWMAERNKTANDRRR